MPRATVCAARQAARRDPQTVISENSRLMCRQEAHLQLVFIIDDLIPVTLSNGPLISNKLPSRHKVGARRCIIRCIKAPLVPNSVILKSAHQATQENHEIKPPHQSKALIRKSLHYDQVSKLFFDYLYRTHDYEHFNIYLLSIPLKTRNTEYPCLVGIYTEINEKAWTGGHIKLDDLLVLHGMSKPLYVKIGQMVAGERVPGVTFDNLTGYHRPQGTKEQSWLGTQKASEVSELPRNTICKLMEMMLGMVARFDAQASQIINLHLQSEQRHRLCWGDSSLTNDMLEMFKDVVFEAPLPLAPKS
ncbi:hypothetical protein PCANC_18206 [Puccinia coronata f. sp. avenae]|uniref:Uncharacterized protein n=1 Tax=Puccinia coronata f. sp. avenae TaxID=200324 RepID=A0A2N5SJU2_9BASI|nr:hypothetical protein PCANC_18206 [Puccinia coronata f. sp. avenae]